MQFNNGQNCPLNNNDFINFYVKDANRQQKIDLFLIIS